MIENLRIELQCTRPIEIRESPELSTAATIGWRRPLILLPAGWRAWNQQQVRAVLSHFHQNREAVDPADNIRVGEYRLKKSESAFRRHMKALSALTSVKTLLPVKVAEESTARLAAASEAPQPDRGSAENLELFDCRNQFNSLKSRNQRSLPESCWVGVE